MKFFYTSSFKKDFHRLPKEIQVLVEQKLVLFLDNPRHPSVMAKKIEGTDYIWEGRITRNYRFTFQIENDLCVLRRVGLHDITKRKR